MFYHSNKQITDKDKQLLTFFLDSGFLWETGEGYVLSFKDNAHKYKTLYTKLHTHVLTNHTHHGWNMATILMVKHASMNHHSW